MVCKPFKNIFVNSSKGFFLNLILTCRVFYFLCINPDVQEKLRLEIENILKGGKVELDRENFKKLT